MVRGEGVGGGSGCGEGGEVRGGVSGGKGLHGESGTSSRHPMLPRTVDAVVGSIIGKKGQRPSKGTLPGERYPIPFVRAVPRIRSPSPGWIPFVT